MRIPRVHIGAELVVGEDVLLDKSQSHYLKHVLRLKPGAALLLFIGFKVASPIVASLSKGLTDTPTRSGGGLVADGAGGVGVAPPPEPLTFNDKVSVARQLADKNPERVAQIVRQWVDTDE